tara:strand:- start:688 stop:2013 length:1326 start_codon:yes stop_codon:yes gene_type:complete
MKIKEPLISCDTVVALPNSTSNNITIFGKNSDRPKSECQPLVQIPRIKNNSKYTQCQFIKIPSTEISYAHVGSKPFWCWGYEHGFNEYQVVIGNEGLGTHIPSSSSPKLVGMEIVRLALERSKSAKDAVKIITDLISTFGQGVFENDQNVRTYDNGYLIADPTEAYIIETAGHEWAVKKVEDAEGISNIHSIETNWDKISDTAINTAKSLKLNIASPKLNFAKTFCDYDSRYDGRGEFRRLRSCTYLQNLKGNINLKEIIFILKDHADGEKENISQNFLDTRTICTHYPDPDSDGNTAASLVSELHTDNTQLDIHWTSMYSPCLGIFLPMFIEGEIPKVLSIGNQNYNHKSPWWAFRSLEESCRTDGLLDNNKASQIRKIWEPIQNEFYKSAKLIAKDANKLKQENKLKQMKEELTQYMRNNTNTVLNTLNELVKSKSQIS